MRPSGFPAFVTVQWKASDSEINISGIAGKVGVQPLNSASRI